MKTQVIRTSIVALLAAAASFGQSSMPLGATIPFSFVAGGKTFAAGEYMVDQSHAGLVIVESADWKTGASMVTAIVQSADIQPVSKLVFHRCGNTYVLSEVWTADQNFGRQTTVKSRERQLEARHLVPETTVVLAKR